MTKTQDFLFAGSASQRSAISGISQGHAFDKHGGDLPGSERRDFGAAAMRDLNTADRVYEFEQHGGTGILFGNFASEMAGWINTNEPDKSTYFTPEDGVEEYIKGKIESSDGVHREISISERDEINRSTHPDHADNFHVGPQNGLRDVSVDQTRTSPEASIDPPGHVPEISTEVVPELSSELSDPEVGSADSGPER